MAIPWQTIAPTLANLSYGCGALVNKLLNTQRHSIPSPAQQIPITRAPLILSVRQSSIAPIRSLCIKSPIETYSRALHCKLQQNLPTALLKNPASTATPKLRLGHLPSARGKSEIYKTKTASSLLKLPQVRPDLQYVKPKSAWESFIDKLTITVVPHDIDYRTYGAVSDLHRATVEQQSLINQYQQNGMFHVLEQNVAKFQSILLDLSRSDPQGVIARNKFSELQAPLPLAQHYLNDFKTCIKMFAFDKADTIKQNLSKVDSFYIAAHCQSFIQRSFGAQAAADFVKMGCEQKIPGYLELSGQVKYGNIFSRARRWFAGCKTGFRSNEFNPHHILENSFNQKITHVRTLCENQKFHLAHAYIQQSSGESKQSLLGVYGEYFKQSYNQLGIERCYENDPFFAQISSQLKYSSVPSAGLNDVFKSRHDMFNAIKQTCAIPNNADAFSNSLMWHLVDQCGNNATPKQMVSDLAVLCKDSAAKTISGAYHHFFDGNGIFKLLNYDKSNFAHLSFHESIHHERNTHTRIFLNDLIQIPCTTKQQLEAFSSALNHLNQSCKNPSLATQHMTFAQDIANALSNPDYDQKIISCGDFSKYDMRLLKLGSEIITAKNNTNVQLADMQELNAALAQLNDAGIARLNGDYYLSEHLTNKTLGSLDIESSSFWQQEKTSFIKPISADLKTSFFNIQSPKTQEAAPSKNSFANGFAAAVGARALQQAFSGNSFAPAPSANYSQTQTDAASACPQCANDADAIHEYFDYLNQGGQPVAISGGQADAAQKAKEDDCNEAPTKLSLLEQIELARKANDYFREQIAKYEAEIVEAIKKKLKENNLNYEPTIHVKDINMKHIMFTESRGKNPVGLHSKRWNPERIVTASVRPCKFNTSHGKVQLNCITKPSTFFPDSWNEFMIVDKIFEALKNIINVNTISSKLIIKGITQEQIYIELHLESGGLISTAYPSFKDLCI